MPVSTAHRTCGYCCAASPNGQCSATSVSALPRVSACAANPCAVSASATDATAAFTERWPSVGLHARRDRPAVLVADLFGERAGLVDRQPLERPGEQRARGGRRGGAGTRGASSRGGGAVALRRPAGRLVARELDVEVAAGRELLEVVAGDVRVEREALGDLGGLGARRRELRTKR